MSLKRGNFGRDYRGAGVHGFLYWLATSSIAPLAYVSLIALFYPIWEVFMFDEDEGINLIKAAMVSRRYSLYGEIWNDQPPLFTYLLAGTMRVFGYEVSVARLLVLVMVGVMFWALYAYIRLEWGHLHAFAALVLIALLPRFVMLSVSVMIGLPAISLAMVSMLCLALWHRRRERIWLLASAGLLALSVLIKLFTGFLAPIFVLGLVLDEWLRSRRLEWSTLRPALLWGAVFGGLGLALGLALIGPSNVMQLITPHLSASREAVYTAEDLSTLNLGYHLKQSPTTLLLALAGLVIAWRARRPLAAYPAAWALAAAGLLAFHSPVWYHHQYLVMVPAAMLGGIAVGEGVRWLAGLARSPGRNRAAALVGLVLVAAFGLLVVRRFPPVAAEFASKPAFLRQINDPWYPERPMVVRMSEHAAKTTWVITDFPMYAFKTGLPVPPEFAVITEKRFLTGSLSEAQIVETVERLKPEQILIGRFQFPSLEPILASEYRLLYERQHIRLFLRLPESRS